MSEGTQMGTLQYVRMSDVAPRELNSTPIPINGGRLYGAHHCRNGDVVLFNRGYMPMFRWQASTGQVNAYTAGAANFNIARTDYFWLDCDPFPGKFFAQVLGDWVMAAWNSRATRCPRLIESE